MINNNAIYVTKPFLPPMDEYIPYLERIWTSGILTNEGQLYKELENKLKITFNWNNTSLFTNGHLALEIALKALNLKPGGEIITTPFTFVSTTAAIVNQGFKPVFCDVTDNYTIDSNIIEDLITDKTVAILPVHVYGFPCDVENIDYLAKKYNFKVIYDAAHALGVQYKGRDISSYGDISMFSFHSTKLFHTIEGGALVYSDSKLKKDIDLNKNFGISGQETIDLIGINAKMNEFQASMGLLLLNYIDNIIIKRKQIYERYFSNLNGLQNICIKRIDDELKYNYSYMPVLFEGNRDKIFEYLKNNYVFARKYFYPCISNVECYKKYFRNNLLVKADKISNNIICLPIYPSLELSQVDYICQLIHDAIKK